MAVSLVLGLALATFTVRASEPPLRYATTWVGNTFGGGPKWVQNFAENLHILPDGTCIVGSFWDEAGREVGIYKEGQPVGKLDHTHMRGGKAVAATDKYIFYANTSARTDQPEVKAGQVAPKKAICYFGVSRFTRDGKPAPFAGGVMNERHMQSLREAPDNHDLIPRGLATDGQLLYVADTAANRVVVLDAEMMVEVRAFAAEAPERLALDGKGHLWAVQSGGRTLIRMNTSGAEVLTKVLPDGVVAEAIDFAPEGTLLVCDNGPRQQVIAFNSDLQEVDTFGERGGMFAGPSPGRAGPFRLAGPTGCGFDAAGNFYVACNVPRGGTVLRAFAPKSPKPRLSETNA